MLDISIVCVNKIWFGMSHAICPSKNAHYATNDPSHIAAEFLELQLFFMARMCQYYTNDLITFLFWSNKFFTLTHMGLLKRFSEKGLSCKLCLPRENIPPCALVIISSYVACSRSAIL